MKLSIVIPVYNEAKTLEKLLAAVMSVDLGTLSKEVIIVDDCSIDGTRDILNKLPQSVYRVLLQEKNQGKGAALRRGFKEATGDFILVQDADLEYDPSEYMHLLQPLLDGRADVVFGSRFVGDRPHRVLFFWHYVGNKFLTIFSNMMTGLNLTDMETCYKAFTRSALQKVLPKLHANRFNFEPEVTARVAQAGLRIYEVGISYNGRTYAEGKKIGWKDAVSALWAIIRSNVSQ
ncbi:MAG: Glycosyl transferase family 2 [Candidatus Peregrinibacteria bacterium GW2011_GWC2_39_14]|nr:MAG: Glycosyl transferase family 2 [Candidatus Peregrinibacteria bacterium GW2011_GWC2_39_14]